MLGACQNPKEASNDDKAKTSVNEERLQGLKKPKDSGNIASLRAQALSIINYRLKNNPKSYALIEADVWEYQFVFNGEMSKQGEYDGIWIDFKPDFTYEYGNRGKVEGSGKYSYEFDRSELLMVDDKSNAKPQEWQVKSAGDALVLVGTALYGDNAVQMKLHRVSDDIRS
jgi:hypothetical protein